MKRGQSGDLLPNSYSSVLKLPDYYYDVVNFSKEFKYQIIYGEEPPKKTDMIEEVKERKKEGDYGPEIDILCTIFNFIILYLIF